MSVNRRLGLPLAALGLSLWLVSAAPTMAQSPAAGGLQLGDCNGTDIAASIRACSALLAGQLPPDVRAKALFNRGVRLQVRGEDDAALADFDEAIKTDAGNALAFSARGALLVRKDNFAAARADLDEAIRLRPSLAPAFTARGLLNLYQGRLDECIADSSQALKLDPRQQAAFNNRGAAYREKGSFDAALQDFNVVIRQNPAASRPLYNRGLTYLRQGNKERALLDYDAALALNPNDPDAAAGRAALLAQTLAARPGPTGQRLPAATTPAQPDEQPGTGGEATIANPGCAAFARNSAVEYLETRGDDWRKLFGKALADWTQADIALLQTIFESCRQEVPRFRNHSARSWPKFTSTYFASLTSEVARLAGQKSETPEAEALVAETEALAAKVGKRTISAAERQRLIELPAVLRGKTKLYMARGYQPLVERMGSPISIAEQAVSTLDYQRKMAEEAERARIANAESAARIAQEEKAAAEVLRNRIAAADGAGFRYTRFADVFLDKQNMLGAKIAVDGFLTVRGNAAILDFPTVGEVGVDLAGLPLDDRRMLLSACSREVARCYFEIRGTVNRIATELTQGIGIKAVAMLRMH